MRTNKLENQADRTDRSDQTDCYAAPRRGSALLIVLGFLSFMMISAVSFAVYMRIERQASSNYRHSTTARHMLNAALYRAIDEIDSELRIPSFSTSGDTQCKFPTNWPGRVRASAVADGNLNDRNTRVLSMESLGFIPGIFVNDVRRYANPHRNDPGNNNSDATRNWRGAKWRTFNNIDKDPVGRYAYLCINVSDMLDVNLCRASGRDSNSNRVSISHLFDDDVQRRVFDDNFVNTDGKYITLQDFYACLFGRDDQVFTSPYHDFVDPKNTAAAPDFGFNDTDNHLVITGSRALPEPSSASTPPRNLYGIGPDDINAAFIEKLDTALPNVNIAGQVNREIVTAMLQDYLDTDSVPRRLDVPSVEMVPMISQLTFVPVGGRDTIVASEIVPDSDPPQTVNNMQLGVPGPPYGMVFVEVMWPFKNWQARQPLPDPNSFKVRVHAYVKVVGQAADAFNQSGDFMGPLLESAHYYAIAPTDATITFSAALETPDDRGANINNFYAMGRVELPNFNKKIQLIDQNGTPSSPFFAENNFVSVSLIVFAQVIDASGNVVDQAPKLSTTTASAIAAPEFGFTHKLFFQTDRVQVTSGAMSKILTYQWDALETPDPRFNYKASNWVLWQPSSVNNDNQKPGHNRSTEILLGQDGRDTDIFMSVADTGYFQSPGELGFIVRPFDFSIGGTPCDLSDPARTPEDAPYMFRTIRIYDHGGNAVNQRRDNIYDHFNVVNPNGTLDGARVNPLSDITAVLEGAIAKTPFDYWISARLAKLAVTPQSAEYKALQTETYDSYDAIDASKRTRRTLFQKANWRNFVQEWRDLMVQDVQPRKISNKTIAESWQTQLRDVYGLFDTMGWYADTGDTMRIFKSGYAHNAETPLHEIDRKMLYSFSLDSFCDRQQLFLYIIRAEVTSPTLFSSVTEARSLAGGRAVALVWRDPYPTGYNKDNNEWRKSDYDFDTTRVSPWYQHNRNAWGSLDESNTSISDPIAAQRRDSYHAHRILFFKQLDK